MNCILIVQQSSQTVQGNLKATASCCTYWLLHGFSFSYISYSHAQLLIHESDQYWQYFAIRNYFKHECVNFFLRILILDLMSSYKLWRQSYVACIVTLLLSGFYVYNWPWNTITLHCKMESASTQTAEEMAWLQYNPSIDTSHRREKQKQIFIVSSIWCCQPVLKETCE